MWLRITKQTLSWRGDEKFLMEPFPAAEWEKKAGRMVFLSHRVEK